MSKSKYSKSIIHEQTADTEVPIPAVEDTWMTVIQDKVQGIQNGTLQIVIHEGRVVQLEWNDRVRFNPPFDA